MVLPFFFIVVIPIIILFINEQRYTQLFQIRQETLDMTIVIVVITCDSYECRIEKEHALLQSVCLSIRLLFIQLKSPSYLYSRVYLYHSWQCSSYSPYLLNQQSYFRQQCDHLNYLDLVLFVEWMIGIFEKIQNTSSRTSVRSSINRNKNNHSTIDQYTASGNWIHIVYIIFLYIYILCVRSIDSVLQ